MRTRGLPPARRLLLAVLFLMAGVAANAQFDNGSLVGTIHDATGAVIAGAAITVTSAATGSISKTMSNGSGDYEIPSLRVGTYTISASSTGYADSVASNIAISVGGRQRIDLTLSVGAT